MISTGDFNSTLSTKDRPSRQRISKEIVALNTDPMDLRDILSILSKISRIYIFLKHTQNIC